MIPTLIGGDLAGRDRDHDLVEQGQPVGGLSERDEGLALAEPGQGHGVRVAEPVGHLGEPAEPVVCGRGVAGHQAAQRVGHEQIAPRDAVDTRLVEQPLRPREPTAGARHLTLVHEAHAQVEAAERRAVDVALVRVRPTRTGPGIGALVVTADEVGGDGEPLEIHRAERPVAVSGEELGVGGGPGPAVERLPARLQRVSGGHVVNSRAAAGPVPLTRGEPRLGSA